MMLQYYLTETSVQASKSGQLSNHPGLCSLGNNAGASDTQDGWSSAWCTTNSIKALNGISFLKIVTLQ